MTLHKNVIQYRGYRYLIWSGVTLVFCLALYFSHGDLRSANGGTWQGYTLGSIATILVLWLTALGIKKRTYLHRLGSLQSWVSAHIYLGLCVAVIATLHSGFQVGLNVHTLAYGLLLLVVVSGIFGLQLYITLPNKLSENLEKFTRSSCFSEVLSLNESASDLSELCGANVQAVVKSAIDRTSIGGGAWDQIFAIDRSKMVDPTLSESGGIRDVVNNKNQNGILTFVSSLIPKSEKKSEVIALQDLLSDLSRRRMLLFKIRRDVQLKALLNAWLYIHIPVSVALLVALSIHILSVFFYW